MIQRRRQLQRHLLVPNARRPAPALEAVVEVEMRDVAVDAGLRHLAHRELRRVRVPTTRQLDVQAAARTLRKIRVPTQPGRLRELGEVGELNLDVQGRRPEGEVLARLERERPMFVGRVTVMQRHVDGAGRHHAPGTLPTDTVHGVRTGIEVGRGRVVVALPAEAPVAEPIRVRHQRVTARWARRRQTGRIRRTQNRGVAVPQAGNTPAEVGPQRQAQCTRVQLKPGLNLLRHECLE